MWLQTGAWAFSFAARLRLPRFLSGIHSSMILCAYMPLLLAEYSRLAREYLSDMVYRPVVQRATLFRQILEQPSWDNLTFLSSGGSE